MDLLILRRDGRPAEGAVVSVAEAPVELTELALVADADGRVSLPADDAGRYVLNVWIDGASHRSSHEAAGDGVPLRLQLPV